MGPGAGGDVLEECPLGKDWNPSFRTARSGCVQMVHETSKIPSDTSSPYPPTACARRFARSGPHRFSRSGRGFPNSVFRPLVISSALARASASPIHAVFQAQRRRRHGWGAGAEDCGWERRVGWGRRDRTRVMRAGARTETRFRVVVETFSFWM